MTCLLQKLFGNKPKVEQEEQTYPKTVLEVRLENIYDKLNYLGKYISGDQYLYNYGSIYFMFDTTFGKRIINIDKMMDGISLFYFKPLKEYNNIVQFYNDIHAKQIFYIRCYKHKIDIYTKPPYHYLNEHDIDMALYEVERYVEQLEANDIDGLRKKCEEYFQNQIIEKRVYEF